MSILSPPVGFVEQRRGKTLWWLKSGWEDQLLTLVLPHVQESEQQSAVGNAHSAIPLPSSLIRNPPAPSVGGQSATSIQSGRGTIQRIKVDPSKAIIIRPYHRGGLVRFFTRDLYWDYPPRPFVELCCTEEARHRGIPTVVVLGARVERVIGRIYRGLLVTQEAKRFHNLWDWLQTEKSVDLRQRTLTVVAKAIARMHNAGIAHADLNPTNVLVCPDSESPQALLIDFDRTSLFSAPVPSALREANLLRFRRFFGKYDVHKKYLSLVEFEYFLQMYKSAFS